jgi:hypothetical protein
MPLPLALGTVGGASRCDRPCAGEVLVVVDLDPGDIADGRDVHLAPGVDQLLEAVLVVQVGVAAPRGLERGRERSCRGRLDQRDADVLGIRLRGGRPPC